MYALTRAIHGILAGDETLAGMLARFEGVPAVFTTEPPTGAAMPYVIIRDPVIDSPWDVLKRFGRDVNFYIAAYAHARGSDAEISAIAERIRRLLHHARPAVEDHTVAVMTCSGPTGAPPEPGVSGRIVSVRARLQEEELV